MRVPLQKELPDHHDAELVLKVYDLRREEVMRASRDAINRQWWPKSADEVLAILKGDHPLNAAYRQTSTYWEMVYGLARHGIVHADYLVEFNGEGLLLYARVEPYLAALRGASSPMAFRNAEWIATHSEAAGTILERMRGRVRAMTESK